MTNKQKNIMEYEKNKTELESFPQIVFIETTRNCNLKCSMCERARIYGNTQQDNLNMSRQVLHKIAKELFPHSEYVDFHGNGEFLCYPYFHEAMELARKYGCKIRTVTNLMTSDKSKLLSLSKDDVLLCVSIDSPYKEQFEKIRLGASFEKLCENLKYLSNLGKSDIAVMMTLAFDNITSLTEMLKLLNKFNINKLFIWNRYLNLDDSNNIIHHLEMANKEIQKAFELATAYGIEIRLLTWPKYNDEYYCGLKYCIKPWMSVHINYDGSIGMCDFNETPKMFSELNVSKSKFTSIWNSKEYIKLRTSFLENKHIDFCSDCCINKRFIDFEDILYPSTKRFIVNNFQNGIVLK